MPSAARTEGSARRNSLAAASDICFAYPSLGGSALFFGSFSPSDASPSLGRSDMSRRSDSDSASTSSAEMYANVARVTQPSSIIQVAPNSETAAAPAGGDERVGVVRVGIERIGV
jgi:hypothetical protein